MNTSQKFYTLFHINKQRAKNGQAPLSLRVYVNGSRSEISTPFKVAVKDWDPNSQKKKDG